MDHLEKLKSVLASRCGLINGFEVVHHPELEILMMNGGHYERTFEKNGETITLRRDPSMRLLEVDTQHMPNLNESYVCTLCVDVAFSGVVEKCAFQENDAQRVVNHIDFLVDT